MQSGGVKKAAKDIRIKLDTIAKLSTEILDHRKRETRRLHKTEEGSQESQKAAMSQPRSDTRRHL